jgi:hypothetical protein
MRLGASVIWISAEAQVAAPVTPTGNWGCPELARRCTRSSRSSVWRLSLGSPSCGYVRYLQRRRSEPRDLARARRCEGLPRPDQFWRSRGAFAAIGTGHLCRRFGDPFRDSPISDRRDVFPELAAGHSQCNSWDDHRRSSSNHPARYESPTAPTKSPSPAHSGLALSGFFYCWFVTTGDAIFSGGHLREHDQLNVGKFRQRPRSRRATVVATGLTYAESAPG